MQMFLSVVEEVERALSKTAGPYFLREFSTADVVFTPYVERMAASLYYYKGYTLRDEVSNPGMARWFAAMEERETYRGTQSDYHTHCHDLPPQMGGCYENGTQQQQANKHLVDHGPWDKVPDTMLPQPENAREVALFRTIKHKDKLIAANVTTNKEEVDLAIRCALTGMMTGEGVVPPRGSDVTLRYIRDRVNVPRDMPIWSGRYLRKALEDTAALAGDRQGPMIATKNRRDQNPGEFR